MLNRLYKEFASYYASITNDRDFKTQMEYVLGSFTDQNPCGTLLELFAGQSVHSIEANETAGIDIWAIDSSTEMKQLALDGGFEKPDQYIVGNLPDSILGIVGKAKIDCVLILFNGICNLTTSGLYELLKNIKEVLDVNGKVFLEYHDIYYVMKYIADPMINYQEATHTDGTAIKYAWPSGEIKWNSHSFTAEVPVRIMFESAGEQETIDFHSVDHIHSTEVVLLLANLLGYKSRVLTSEDLWSMAFQYSVVVELTLNDPIID